MKNGFVLCLCSILVVVDDVFVVVSSILFVYSLAVAISVVCVDSIFHFVVHASAFSALLMVDGSLDGAQSKRASQWSVCNALLHHTHCIEDDLRHLC